MADDSTVDWVSLWESIGRVVSTKAYTGANDVFSKFRAKVKKAAQAGEVSDQASEASLGWEFLIGMAAAKQHFRSQIIEVVLLLKHNPEWHSAWKANPKFQADIVQLHIDLQAAFVALDDVSPSSLQGKSFTYIDLKAESALKQVAKNMEELESARSPTIAVIGNRGVGKSTLVNSLRSLKPTDPQAAKVGSDETSVEVVCYPVCGLIIKDVPGAGGSKVKVEMGEDYVKEFELASCDAVIFVYDKVLSQSLLRVATILKNDYDLPVYLVRNKVGLDCQNDVDDGNFPDEETAFQSLRKIAKEQLERAGVGSWSDEDLYFVESKYKYAVVSIHGTPYAREFQRLKKALLTNIKNEANQRQIQAILTANAKQLAKERADRCFEKVPNYVVASSLSGMVPLVGVSEAGTVIVGGRAAVQFLKEFALTPDLLGESPGLKELADYVFMRVAGSVVGMIAMAAAMDAAADSLVFIPVIGVIISMAAGSAFSAYSMSYYCTTLINRLQTISESVYQVALNQKVNSEIDSDIEKIKQQIKEMFPEYSPSGSSDDAS